MRSGEFISLSASTMMLTALGIDVMLPAFAGLRVHFGLQDNPGATAQIVSFFFLGQIAQLLFGVLSDRVGRLVILRTGFPLYIAGGVVAAFAPTFEIMLIARFVAGVGASAVFMTTIAGIRDRYAGDEMARILSLVFTIFLFTPVLAPFLGMFLLKIASWQAVFLSAPVFAVIVFCWSFRLEESLSKQNRTALKWSTVKASLQAVLTNRTFLRYTAVTTLLFTGLSSWVGSSERIVGEFYQRPDLFPWVFGGIGLFMAGCALMNSRLSVCLGAQKVIRILLIVYTAVALLLLISTCWLGDPPPMVLFFIAVAALLGINLAVEPNSSALALEPMGDKAGVASSVYGTLFFAVGAAAGAVVSGQLKHGLIALIVAFLLIGLAATLLAFAPAPEKK